MVWLRSLETKAAEYERQYLSDRHSATRSVCLLLLMVSMNERDAAQREHYRVSWLSVAPSLRWLAD